MTELKYQKELSVFENCDLSGFSEQKRKAFRWTFAEISDYRNFMPRYLLDTNKPKTECIGWGLSFYTRQDKAESRLKLLTKDKPNLRKKLGTHLAEGMLYETDGISDSENNYGHFTLFEYIDVTLLSQFNVIAPIR